MRVDYTLPGLELGNLSDSAVTEDDSLTFRAQLMGATAQVPLSCEQQLRLDVRPYTATYLAPPRPPKTLEINEPQAQRSRWRSMLWRHTGDATLPSYSAPGGQAQSIATMVEMLLDMQQMEDAIVSHSVALTRG